MLTAELLANSLIAGILLGGFYAAISIGVSISFGLLDIANIAHPVFAVLGAYTTWLLSAGAGMDPIVAGFVAAPAFYALGLGLYVLYHHAFERRGEQSLQGLVFFFGILFLVEMLILLRYGADYRLVETRYTAASIRLGVVGLPFRLVLPFVIGVAVTLALQLFLTRTFVGRMVLGVSQDGLAVRLMGANPTRLKAIAFGVSIATASIAGTLMIMIGPVEPSAGREFIGRVFAVAILGGMGSVTGTLLAAITLGVVESLTSTFYGPAWALVASFGILLLVLAVRPAGLLGR